MLQMSFSGLKKAGHPVVWFLSLAGHSTLTIIIAVVVCAVVLVLVLILVFIYKRKKLLAVCSHITHTHIHIFTSICGEKILLVNFFSISFVYIFFSLSGIQRSKNTRKEEAQNNKEVRKHLCK